MKIVFMGTPDFALAPLEALASSKHELVWVISQPDKPQGRKQILLPTPVHHLADTLGLPFSSPIKLKDGTVAQKIKDLACDVLVTAAYGRILPPAILEAPRLACINLHGSLLPKYRGASPVQAALLNGDAYTGITIIRMVEEMDAGAILAQEKIKIEEEDDIPSLMKKISEAGARLLLPLLDQLEQGTQEETPQDASQATFVSFLTKDTGKISWKKYHKNKIFSLYQGTKPWPSCFSYFQGKRCKLLQISKCSEEEEREILSVFSHEKADLFPGRLLSHNKKVYVLVKKESDENLGLLEILSWQLEGGKAMEAKAFAHNLREKKLSFQDESSL